MTQLSSLITEDPRTPIGKLRRHGLQVIAKRNEIIFDPSGPATDLRKLIEGSGIDVLKEANFQKTQVKDEDGIIREVVEPIVKPHATQSKDINHAAIIEANAKANEKETENTELRKELEDMKAMMAKLMPKEPNEAKSDVMNEAFYRDKYTELFKKKPHHKMKLETIKAKVDAES